MGNKYIFGLIAVIAIIVGIYLLSNINNNSMVEDNSVSMKDSNDVMIEGYSAKLLAGNTSPYLEFNSEDYQKALSENKTILLYFYANWCPTCKAEEPKTFEAFNELNDENIIGFRVNYKDSDTDSSEVELAKEFGIPYQHTKVIIKNGTVVLKSLEEWNKDRYLEELNKVK